MENCGRETYLNRKISTSVAFKEDLHIYRTGISRGRFSPEDAFKQLQEEEIKPFGPVLREEVRVCFNTIAEGKCNKYPALPVTSELALYAIDC